MRNDAYFLILAHTLIERPQHAILVECLELRKQLYCASSAQQFTAAQTSLSSSAASNDCTACSQYRYICAASILSIALFITAEISRSVLQAVC